MLYIIGLGLSDEKDITVNGLETIKSCDIVYLENYTSILQTEKDRLEKFYGKSVTLCDRESVELDADTILEQAISKKVAFLVVGDPFGATTHTDLFLRAREKGVEVKVIHNASVMNAIGACGLQLYNFGQTVSIPFFTEKWKPDSFYDKIAQNDKSSFHTLCLLDIKVKEQSEENLMKNKKIYDPPRFMTADQAIEQLVEVEEKRGEGIFDNKRTIVVLARLAASDQLIVSGTVEELRHKNFGKELHCLVIPSRNLHDLELKMIQLFHWSKQQS